MLVQEELVRRRLVHTSSNGKKRNFSSNHCFAQVVYCGECGELYRRIHWNNRGCKSIVWRCLSRLESTGIKEPCHARTVNELLLQEISLKAINQTLGNREHFISILQNNVTKAVKQSDTESVEGIDNKLTELQHELLNRTNKKEEYDAVATEIFRLREMKKQAEVDTVTRDEQLNRITNLHDFIKAQPNQITEFDENLVKQLIGKITVFENSFEIEFKSGVSVEIEG